MLTHLLSTLSGLPPFMDLLERRPAQPQALLTSARPFVTAGLRRHTGQPVVLLTAREDTARRIITELESWLPPVDEGGPPVYLFAEPDALPRERIAWSSRVRQQRLTALAALQSRTGAPPVVVAGAQALAQMTLPVRELRLALRPVKIGGVVRLEQMAVNWAQTGYQPVDVVEEPGTFARRGGIVDIWPPNLPEPLRIDLFGDEVESLRVFDPATQRTVRQVKEAEIGPGGEALSKYGPAALARLGIEGERLTAPENLEKGVEESPLQDPNLLLTIREELRREVEHLAGAESFHGMEWYLPYFYDRPASLLDYVPQGGILLVDDGAELMDALHDLARRAETLRTELERTGELPRRFRAGSMEPESLRKQLIEQRPIILGMGDLDSTTSSANTPLARAFAPGPRYGGKTKEFIRDIAKLRDEGQRTVLVTRQAARLQALLEEADIDIPIQHEVTHLHAVTLVQGVYDEGFIARGIKTKDQRLKIGNLDATAPNPQSPISQSPNLPSPNLQSSIFNLHFYTDTELFGWSKPKSRKRSQKTSKVAAEIFFADAKPGDFVVHLEHGIGQFAGLVKIELGGMELEYLQVDYAQSDKLYVPVHQADRLSRYVGAGQLTPAVTRLGTADWATVKERAKRAVADIADDLLKLYAERELVTGYAYSPDGPWQTELEASFPYQETDDQLQAIADVKRDMESDHPMDRLICGDVGYGKTEVAVRAAFKAILDGKQVAVLVPTTVLAQQHYRTFSQRLAHFPVRVEMLSRFRTPAQQTRIKEGLLNGSVDLVVGTHSLLGESVEFKNLSMLIVDEEQRFGVAQKEKLKQLRTNMDVLTLSATPIPRTLHMSLSGVRDMSAINTPPKERQPVHTVLAEYDDTLVRQAIQRELSHKGQVFFVHNRVRGLRMLADRIQRLNPEAAVAMAHGQMGERQLEETMLRFADGDIDVLVCTTIVENGLDIPNANTIIINRADHFGLAQLYQLRGRVGRSARRGYCYLLYDKHTSLSFDARRRLHAIMESSEELGAGFRIAMRDLEIRGAGDILGARQHGQIDNVGFDLYTRLLAQAVNEARRKKEVFEVAERRSGEVTTEPADTPSTAPQPQPPIPSPLDAPFDLNDPLAPPVTMQLPIDAKIPEWYIGEEELRLQLYRRIAGLTTKEGIDEMRRELVDRFGPDKTTGSVPEAVENLLFQIRVKMLAQQAGVEQIGRELDQLVLRSETLEGMNRSLMQRRLRLGLGYLEDDDFIPEEAVRVGRNAIYLPVDEAGRWRTALLRTLQIMGAG
ncbi:MAG: transcription-repair coupling factor [Caldilineaceae bacterium]|nr:transcription-repair coupling factor [Caldilineaceae bacterium]